MTTNQRNYLTLQDKQQSTRAARRAARARGGMKTKGCAESEMLLSARSTPQPGDTMF
jgi:hypothetical protein